MSGGSELFRLATERFSEICGLSLCNELQTRSSLSSIDEVFRAVPGAQPPRSSSALDSPKALLQGRMEKLFEALSPIFTRLASDSQKYPPRAILLAALRVTLETDADSHCYIDRVNNLGCWTLQMEKVLHGLPQPLPDDQTTLPILSEVFTIFVQIFAHSMFSNNSFRGRLGLLPFFPRCGSQFAPEEFRDSLNNLERLVSDLRWIASDWQETLLKEWPPEEAGLLPCSRRDFENSTTHKIADEGKKLMKRQGQRPLNNMIFLVKLLHVMLSFLPEEKRFDDFPATSLHYRMLRLRQLHDTSHSVSQEFVANALQQMTNFLSVFEDPTVIHTTRPFLVLIARSLLQTHHLLTLFVHILDGSQRRKLVSFAGSSNEMSLNRSKVSQQLRTLRILTSSTGMAKHDKSPLNSLWERAISKYKVDTKFDLRTDSSIASITLEGLKVQVEDGAFAFTQELVENANFSSIVAPVFSALGQLAESIGEASQQAGFPGSAMVAGSISILFQAVREVQASNDFILELFKDLSAFMRRMQLHTKAANHPELQDLFVEILCQFIVVMGTTYKVIRRGRFRRWLSYVGRQQDKVRDEAHEFKRLCSILDSYLLTLLFEQARDRNSSPKLAPLELTDPKVDRISSTDSPDHHVSNIGNGVCLLSLDGGGVKVATELFILHEVMYRLQVDWDLDEPLRPAQIFDMIAGTGTGGLIALFLGRLGMTIPEAIRGYREVFEAVYEGFSVDVSKDRNELEIKTIRFENKVKEIVGRYTQKSEVSMIVGSQASSPVCNTFVCAMPASNMAHPRLFRTYNVRAMPSPNCTIWEAARVTTAMPGIFREMEIEDGFVSERFVDGGFRCNNPTRILLDEAKALWPDRGISCLLSLGAGHPGTISLSSSESELASLTRNICQDCEATANDIERLQQSSPELRNYWRFNTQQGLQGLSLEEWQRLPEMKTHVTSYLQQAQTDHQLSMVVQVLEQGQRSLHLESTLR